MKKFVIKLLVFLSIMFILDRGFGVAMNYLQKNAKGGYVGHHNYILNQANEDILIFGSSRAIHHYNPQIIKDCLGMSCYNCGQDGNGIVLFYGWWQLMKDRHHPRLIIYDVNPSFDLLVGENNSKYLGWLRSEYDNDDVKQIFEDIDPTEKYKMQSMMYRFNSKFLQNIIDYFHPLYQIGPNGYLPLNGELDIMKIKEDPGFENLTYDYDTLKLGYIKKLVADAKKYNIKIVFVASPVWYGMDEDIFTPLVDLCDRSGVCFYNLSNKSDFKHNNELFKDGTHLNATGADLFTREFCTLLMNRYN